MHGDLDQRILEKTKEIELNPLDPQLYLERGELYVLHEEFSSAKTDFSFCIHHDLVNARVMLGMSKSFYSLNAADSALLFINQALDIEPYHLPAIELKGKILARLDRYCEAAESMTALLALADHPSPVLFLDASRDMAACESPGSKERAIEVIKDGLKKLGMIHSLQKDLVFLFQQSGRYEDAIQVQSSIIEQAQFKSKPYFERAQLYIEMQLPEKAKEDLLKAISSIEILPVQKRNIPSIEKLYSEITTLLHQLEN